MDKILLFNRYNESVKALRESDEKLNQLISLIGDIELVIRQNHFESLVMSIIGQQLSAKAAGSIRNRVKTFCTDFSPNYLKTIPLEQFRALGVSKAKISYIHDLCEKILSNEINFNQLEKLPNEEIVRSLTTVKGIGKWTAEMFLIFSLGRTNILSLTDAGLQRATKWLYSMSDSFAGKYLEQHAHKWLPYQAIASLYLWEAIDRGFVDSGKTIEELINNS